MAALIRIVRVCVVAITVVGAVALTTPSSLAGAAAKVTVSPTTGLTSGQHISVSVAGEPPNATLLALECVPAAVSIGEDGCENRVNQVFFSNAKGRGSAPRPAIRLPWRRRRGASGYCSSPRLPARSGCRRGKRCTSSPWKYRRVDRPFSTDRFLCKTMPAARQAEHSQARPYNRKAERCRHLGQADEDERLV